MAESGMYLGNIYKNVDSYTKWLNKKMIEIGPQEYRDIVRKLDSDYTQYENQYRNMFSEWIDKYYPEEYNVICTTDIEKINNYLNGPNGYTKNNLVDPLYIDEILNSDDLEKYIELKYSVKSVPKDILMKSAKIKENLDNWYMDIPYDKFKALTREYLSTRDSRRLHNLLYSQ